MQLIVNGLAVIMIMIMNKYLCMIPVQIMFICSCRHKTTFAVTSIFEIETNNNVVGMIVYYAILHSFTLMGIICVLFMFCVQKINYIGNTSIRIKR